MTRLLKILMLPFLFVFQVQALTVVQKNVVQGLLDVYLASEQCPNLEVTQKYLDEKANIAKTHQIDFESDNVKKLIEERRLEMDAKIEQLGQSNYCILSNEVFGENGALMQGMLQNNK